MADDKMSKVVAIDGPSGSGKSTLAKALALKLKIMYVDTGALYRALAFKAHERGISFGDGCDEMELEKFLNKIELTYYGDREGKLVEIDGEDLTEKIRTHFVSKLASRISQFVVIREYLLKVQRDLSKERVVVMEGRDIGTVVFPQSFCKLFVTANVEVRAERRLEQLFESGQSGLELEKS